MSDARTSAQRRLALLEQIRSVTPDSVHADPPDLATLESVVEQRRKLLECWPPDLADDGDPEVQEMARRAGALVEEIIARDQELLAHLRQSRRRMVQAIRRTARGGRYG